MFGCLGNPMHITRVELENIKNYEAGVFDLEPGVTAICGPNGSGKTTILEAVAWALFDHIPYKKEDFLRRGTKKGWVRVNFVSSIDGREYTVYRDTGNGYYIYDPMTRIRLVEQKNQVGGWIKEHLGVDPSVDLRSLFTSAIGVPQGTFTVDFAEQPSKRKIEFDKVLRVDEYQRCSDELLPFMRFVDAKVGEIREQIARTEMQVAALDDLIVQRRQFNDMMAQLTVELPVLEAERQASREELDRLDNLSREIERLEADEAALVSNIHEAEIRSVALREEVARAQAATDAVERCSEGFKIYTAASARLLELESELTRRDSIKNDLTQIERQQIRLQGSVQNLADKLERVLRDKEELHKLVPIIERQTELEARRRELQVAAGEVAALQERLTATDRDLELLRIEYRDLTHRLEECEKLKALASRTSTLENSRKKFEAELREKQIKLERLAERKAELRRIKEGLAHLVAEIDALEQEMKSVSVSQSLIDSIAPLEDEDRRVTGEIALIRAAVDLDERTLGQIKDGLCPLLAQRCLNMKEGETLDGYFRGRVGADRSKLSTLEARRIELHREIDRARAAIASASAMETMRPQIDKYKQDLELQKSQASALEKEIAALNVSEQDVRHLSDRLQAIDIELRSAHEAKVKFEGAAPLRQRLDNLKGEGARKKELRLDLNQRLTDRVAVKEQLASVEREIEALEDPRGRARALDAMIANEGQLRSALADLEAEDRRMHESMRSLNQTLQVFARLDEDIIAERERRAASERHYRTYIENQPIASLLASKEEEHSRLQDILAMNRTRLEATADKLAAALAGYDGGRHARARVALENAINRASAAAFELSALEQKLEAVGRAIDELSEVKQKLDELLDQKRECEEVQSVSELARDVLKKAAPFITEAHLQSISIEANQLYRDLSGNPFVTLRWDPGYEIILEEAGHDRPFISLSGGEQMVAALAVRLALLKELSDMRIAFFDEPTSNMDEERRHNLAEQIGRIKDFDQLFVISHDDSFEGFTDQMIVLGANGNGA
jgi:exonuclease SbcC